VAAVRLRHACQRLFNVLAATGPGRLTAAAAGDSCAHGVLLRI